MKILNRQFLLAFVKSIFPFTTYFIPFATDLKYVSSACCIIQSSKQTRRINRRIIKISGGYKNDKGNKCKEGIKVTGNV